MHSIFMLEYLVMNSTSVTPKGNESLSTHATVRHQYAAQQQQKRRSSEELKEQKSSAIKTCSKFRVVLLLRLTKQNTCQQ